MEHSLDDRFRSKLSIRKSLRGEIWFVEAHETKEVRSRSRTLAGKFCERRVKNAIIRLCALKQ